MYVSCIYYYIMHIHPGPCSLAGAWQDMFEKTNTKYLYRQALNNNINIVEDIRILSMFLCMTADLH